MGRLFGTDGARGIANTELTCELAMNIGRAAALVLAKHSGKEPRILIGADTRLSSGMLECALASGICSVGANAVLIGVVPTPATALLVRELGCQAGVMISASHNPCEYNGIKLFDGNGYKLSDEIEEEIEGIVLDGDEDYPTPIGEKLGKVEQAYDSIEIYEKHLIETVDVRFDGIKVAIDCANGSASVSAKKIFETLGAECIMLSDTPNGVNINDHCGSTDLTNLKNVVLKKQCDLGLAFDGDADRCLAVDSEGNVVDGDKMIAISAKELKELNKLKNNTVVMTVMSNIGFFKFAENNGIDVVATKVGDRYVLEEMKRKGYCIGGEQSGHIIYLEHASTGDGQLSGIQLLATIKRSGKTLKELSQVMESFPQVLVNVRTSAQAKDAYADDIKVQKAIKEAELKLGSEGRVLVRASGTEPLIRVMIEGRDFDEISTMAQNIAEKIQVL